MVHLHSPLTLGAAARRRRGGGTCPWCTPTTTCRSTSGRRRRARRERPRGPRRARGTRPSTPTSPGSPTAATSSPRRPRPRCGCCAPTGCARRRRPCRTASTWTGSRPARATRHCGRRYALPPGRPLILSVGRLSPEKRADVLIAAVARLDSARPATPAGTAGDEGPVLVLAGTGPDEGRLRSLARHYGVADRVLFLGFVADDDLPGLYRLADVFAIASQAELQSLVTMAAMASGLPVVAVDAGALAELVHAGENGFLARPGRAAEIAGSLGLLCRDADLRARMSKASCADHRRPRRASPARPVGIHLPRACVTGKGEARGTAEQQTSEGERWPALNSRPCHCSSSSATPAGGTAAPRRPSRRPWSRRCPDGSSRSSATRCAAPTCPACCAGSPGSTARASG